MSVQPEVTKVCFNVPSRYTFHVLVTVTIQVEPNSARSMMTFGSQEATKSVVLNFPTWNPLTSVDQSIVKVPFPNFVASAAETIELLSERPP